jgi:hypothetical protein
VSESLGGVKVRERDPLPEVVRPPARRELLLSAAVTIGAVILVGLVAVVVAGSVAVFVDIAMTDRSADYQTQTGLPIEVFRVLLVLVLLVIWPATCRFGLGTPGDAVASLRVLSTDGGYAARWRVWARSGIYLAVFGACTLVERAGLGALLVLLLWAVALVRRDRRSAVDLLLGLVPHTGTAPKTAQPHPWALDRG